MEEKIDIWLVGNTGLRNPNRIQEGFKAFANSPYVGKLRGKENEIGFMNFLNDQGIIQNEAGKDTSGSHARKWRLMFSKNGFIYPQVKKKDGDQDELGQLDDITPFGRAFLKADTYPAVQECYLRALSVEQFAMPDGNSYFSPLRWILAIMLELERRTGSSEITRIEFALWGHTTNPSYSIEKVVDNILDLRIRRKQAPSKRNFDKKEVAERGKHYDKKSDNFLDYSDMNMRYLRISGVLQRKGRGMIFVPAKHILAEKLAKSTSNEESIMIQYKRLCEGAELPTDNLDTAKALLNDLMKQMKERHILFDLLSQTDEIQYAKEQCNQWQEIADYMELLIRGGGKRTYDDDNVIEVPKDETPAYLEWILWRASLAIDHMVNKPYEVRGFKLDSDFLPVSAAGGGKGDLYCEFNDFTILTEVTMSTSSRQEAMEGEPVRRHVSDAVLKYDKPVYGMFIAVKIDTNTAETFRHGIWYARGDLKQRLDIVPLTLAQYREYFMAMFRTGHANPEKLRELILLCETRRDILNAPGWKEYIGNAIDEKIKRMEQHGCLVKEEKKLVIAPGTLVYSPIAGKGQVIAIEVSLPKCQTKSAKFPYLNEIPEELNIDPDGRKVKHDRFGEGMIFAYVIAFKNTIISLSWEEISKITI